jgi:hypothetical protein
LEWLFFSARQFCNSEMRYQVNYCVKNIVGYLPLRMSPSKLFTALSRVVRSLPRVDRSDSTVAASRLAIGLEAARLVRKRIARGLTNMLMEYFSIQNARRMRGMSMILKYCFDDYHVNAV